MSLEYFLSHSVVIYQRFVSLQCFSKQVIWCLPSQSLYSDLLNHLCEMECFFGWVLQFQTSCVWHRETSISTSVGKLGKDLGYVIPCHATPCYMRDVSSVTVSQLVCRGTIGAMTGRAWNQQNGMEETGDCRINKPVFHKTLVVTALLWLPPDNAVLPRMWV